jgi:alpha-tubulin suppressor-like RCC1 family protein
LSSPQLLPFENNRIIKICSGYQHSIVLKGNGKVFGFGYNQVYLTSLILRLGN